METTTEAPVLTLEDYGFVVIESEIQSLKADFYNALLHHGLCSMPDEAHTMAEAIAGYAELPIILSRTRDDEAIKLFKMDRNTPPIIREALDKNRLRRTAIANAAIAVGLCDELINGSKKLNLQRKRIYAIVDASKGTSMYNLMNLTKRTMFVTNEVTPFVHKVCTSFIARQN